jgi:hypothetical protein
MKETVQSGEWLHTLFSHFPLAVLSQAMGESGSQNLLTLTIERQWTEAALLLIEKGTPVDWRGREGRTALHDASIAGDVRVASALLDKGAAVEAEDDEGRTAFYRGCICGHVGIVELFLKSKHFTPSMWRKHRDGTKGVVCHAMCVEEPLVLQALLRHGPGILEHQGSFWACVAGRVLTTHMDMEGRHSPMVCYRQVRTTKSSYRHD